LSTSKIRQARLNAGMTVLEVTKALGVTDAAVYLWETGQITPKVENLKRIAALYGTTIDYLVSDDIPDDQPAT